MAFTGWPAEAVEFYEGLAADNSKTYWTQHKAVFEDDVHGPLAALLDELATEFGPAKIARPYRDVRFSADKSPYKLGCYAIFERGGYVRFSADGLTAGRGRYHLEPDQLARYRNAVAADASGAELAGLVARLGRAGIEVGGGETLKTVPRGFPKDHPRADLLRHKGLIAWRSWPVGAWLGTRRSKDRVVTFLRTAAPLQDWLDAHV